MAVPTVNIRVNYQGDGVTTSYVFGFYVPKPEYMAVIYRDAEGNPRERTDFTVVLNPNQDVDPGGALTFDTAPVAGELGVIFRFVPYQQQTSYTPYDPFRAKSHEGALDFLEFQIQQLKEVMDRAVVSDPVDPGEQLLLPAYSPGRHWQWSNTIQGAIANGLTLAEQDARWAAKVHGHAQTDVTGLVDALAARELTVDHDADVGMVQFRVDDSTRWRKVRRDGGHRDVDRSGIDKLHICYPHGMPSSSSDLKVLFSMTLILYLPIPI